MSATPWLPFYVRDYLADTMHLSRDEHGAYLLLLMACWQRGGKLPDDDHELARITKCADLDDWKNVREKLARFFKISYGVWRQKRLTKEYEKSQRLHEGRVLGGRIASAQREAKRQAEHVVRARTRQPHKNINTNLRAPPPRPRARETPVGRKKKQENGALADIEAKPPRFATIERSSRPAVRQPSNAKSRLMQKVARWLPEDAVAGFWAAMMGPDAQQTLDRAVEQMRASGWEDRG